MLHYWSASGNRKPLCLFSLTNTTNSGTESLILNCRADILNEHEGYNFPVSVPRRLNTKTILFPYDLEQRVSVFLVTVATVTKQQGEVRWAAG